MTKAKKLTMNQVKKQYQHAHTKQDYELKDGLNITFSPIFPHGDIERLLNELAAQIKHAEEKGINISEKFIMEYTLFLTIKHFTHLGKEISDKFEEQISQMEWIVDTGYFKEIIENVFAKSEIQKVFDKAVEISGRFLFLQKITQQMYQEVQNLDLKNKEVLDVLVNNAQ